MTDGFYREFEDQFRGSRELIKSRLNFYRPYLDYVREKYPGSSALDIGCGRGEWLELLSEYGFQAKGVDLDQGMLDACVRLGLSVENVDGLAYLKRLPDSSLSSITAFHVIEHISFEDLKCLFAEAFRVLKPHGVLIFETPNSENLQVGTRFFYLDPTHTKPLPDLLLSFMAQYVGFERCVTLRLNEDWHENDSSASLWDVFSGVSPDLAVVAQKEGDASEGKDAPELFMPDRSGNSLEKMVSRYDKFWCENNDGLRSAIAAGEGRLLVLEGFMQQAAACMKECNAQLVSVQNELQAVYASKSWKLTAPLRFVSNCLKKMRAK